MSIIYLIRGKDEKEAETQTDRDPFFLDLISKKKIENVRVLR